MVPSPRTGWANVPWPAERQGGPPLQNCLSPGGKWEPGEQHQPLHGGREGTGLSLGHGSLSPALGGGPDRADNYQPRLPGTLPSQEPGTGCLMTRPLQPARVVRERTVSRQNPGAHRAKPGSGSSGETEGAPATGVEVRGHALGRVGALLVHRVSVCTSVGAGPPL